MRFPLGIGAFHRHIAAMAGEESTDYGRVAHIVPGVRRITAPNPGPFTYHGTGTYILGVGTVAVFDPGPDDEAHVAAVLNALSGERISHIFITHNHRDHSPGALPLAHATGAKIVGCAPIDMADDGPRADAAFDAEYRPDHVLCDGEHVEGDGWTVEAVATPGHTSNHLCFAWVQQRILFTGDHVMGWSTTVVSPPDGDMAAYMASLEKLIGRDDRLYLPTHGAPVTNPIRLTRGLLAHRRQRERQILSILGNGPSTIAVMVERMYASVDKRLHAAAGRSVLAHLLHLRERRLVAEDDGEWRLSA